MNKGIDPDDAIGHVIASLNRRPEHLRVLAHVASLGLSDAWIGAGFVRNAIWDDLHGHEDPTALADVDVVYFDATATQPELDAQYEAILRAHAPSVPWSVKNQARMHVRNGDRPYRDTAHALTCWPESCTAVGARLGSSGIEILAPLGLEDLFALVVRPTSHFQSKLDVYRQRVAAKNWHRRWPRLRIEAIG